MNLQGLEASIFHGWNVGHALLIPVVKLFFYDVIVMKERLYTQILFYRISRVGKELLISFLNCFNL